MAITGPEFMNLGSGFDGATPAGGNTPADSVFDQVHRLSLNLVARVHRA